MIPGAVNEQTELRLIGSQHADELFRLMDRNREHLRPWQPWVDVIQSAAHVAVLISAWQRFEVQTGALHAGIWHRGQLCGMINHQGLDRANSFAFLSYWLDASHQGKGIMTECCRAFVAHSFSEMKLHRVAIECATENLRSRAIPERLGMELEGITRQSERLHDRFVDHAIYALLEPAR